MSSVKPRPVAIACFGEALWDVLPLGIFLGGAPLNVAYHLARLGVTALPISAVGRDFLGEEACRRIAGWGVSTDLIARLEQPTGTVLAELDKTGSAHYTIHTRVAWDRIPASRALRQRRTPAALVFGSLALRSAANRAELTKLLLAWPEALRVVDLNLRAPFDRGAGVDFALRHAEFVKLNDEELARMAHRPTRTVPQIAAAARAFADLHALTRVCVTAGARGAGVLWDGEWFWTAGRKVEVRDTVGAGDSFLAAFLAAVLRRGESPAQALEKACRLGEFVAGCDGATPPYTCDASGRPRRRA